MIRLHKLVIFNPPSQDGKKTPVQMLLSKTTPNKSFNNKNKPIKSLESIIKKSLVPKPLPISVKNNHIQEKRLK